MTIRTKLHQLLPITALLTIVGTAMIGYSDVSAEPGQHLEGTWLVFFAGSHRIGALHTFTPDGGVVVSPPGLRFSTAHGEWVRTGDRLFATTFYQFRQNEQGQVIGYRKIRETVYLNETLDGYQALGCTEDYDRDGNLEVSNCDNPPFPSRATRVRVEPLK